MPEKTLEERITALEEQIGAEALELAFREQGEVIKRIFDRHIEEFERRQDAKLEAELEANQSAKLVTDEDQQDTKGEPTLFPKNLDDQWDARCASLLDMLQTILSRLDRRESISRSDPARPA